MFCLLIRMDDFISCFQNEVHMGDIIAVKDPLVFDTASELDNDPAIQARMQEF